jgi:hypothetical protein
MELREIDALLDPRPLPLEMGVERLPSGALHVAVRTPMAGCKGRMLTWWFGWLETSQHYSWWHPADHVSSAWENWAPGRYIGAVHVVEERLGGEEVYPLRIQFREPEEFFTPAVLREAMASGKVSAVVSGRVGVGREVERDAAGRILGGRLFHVARDTAYGMTLRSHFYLGADLPGTPEEVARAVPEAMGLGLMQHSHSEFAFLARFLPALYHAENRDREEIPFPW